MITIQIRKSGSGWVAFYNTDKTTASWGEDPVQAVEQLISLYPPIDFDQEPPTKEPPCPPSS